VAEEAVVHPGGGGGVRLADGGRFGPLRGAPRRKATGGGLLRGDALPACRPGARTLPGQSGMSATRYYDYEYERRGVANVFAFFEPKGCWRHMEEVTERRTGRDFAFLRACVRRSIRLQSVDHQVDHRYEDDRFATRRSLLIILTQTPVSPKPSQCSLHYPAPLQHHKPFLFLRALDDL
jgi:hypothetical protein